MDGQPAVDELNVDALGVWVILLRRRQTGETACRAPGRAATKTLIIQGERDALGKSSSGWGYTLSGAIKLHWLTAGDHDLKPLKKLEVLIISQHLLSAAEAIAAFRPGASRRCISAG